MSSSKLYKQRQIYLSFEADNSQIYDGRDLQKKLKSGQEQRQKKIELTDAPIAKAMRYVNIINITNQSGHG